jgi:hypothetical protein
MRGLARLAALLVAGLLCSATTQAADSWSAPVPANLLAHIRATVPGAEIVRPDEIDSKSCQPVADNPTVVQGDLTGKHRTDFAVLLKLKETGKQTMWQGKKLTEAQFALMLFSDNGHDGYSSRRLNEFTDFVPLGVFVDVEPAGKLHNASTGKDLTTHHATVSLVFCEKSETAYYIHDDKVTAIPVTD